VSAGFAQTLPFLLAMRVVQGLVRHPLTRIAVRLASSHAGLLTIPLMAALLLSSTLCGQLDSRTGRFKRFLDGGAIS